MKNQVFNPYLPSWEYVPDGEPRVFGDRIYVYGSHDRFNAPMFCLNDYVCWSAPLDDLSDWKYEGIIFKKNQDPKNKLGLRILFAPDVVQGPDGKYYLYYAFDFYGMMGVAVSESPTGPFQYKDHIHYKDGTIWGRKPGDQFPFDPGVLVDDDGRVYMYSGFLIETPAIASGFHKLKHDGGTFFELESDMVTIKTEPKVIFPIHGEGSFKGHEFFEASSIRKDGDKYIFVYSSLHNHELCYAVSDRPDGGFEFGGTLVDIGDVFLDGVPDEAQARNYMGNTHGGMLLLNGQWYIFYHRQTNRSSYSRQACAEKLYKDENGRFMQAEVTSCGLNDGPLLGVGRYEARIACNLYSKNGAGRYDCKNPKKVFKDHPYFTQTGKDREGDGDQYIANMKDGAVAGFKYFEMGQGKEIIIEYDGLGEGSMKVSDSPGFESYINVEINGGSGKRKSKKSILDLGVGKKPLYFMYCGEGAIDFIAFELV